MATVATLAADTDCSDITQIYCTIMHINIRYRGKSGGRRNLVVTLNVQWTSFTAKSGFQMTTTKHGFSVKSGFRKISGFTKILCTPNIPLHHTHYMPLSMITIKQLPSLNFSDGLIAAHASPWYGPTFSVPWCTWILFSFFVWRQLRKMVDVLCIKLHIV